LGKFEIRKKPRFIWNKAFSRIAGNITRPVARLRLLIHHGGGFLLGIGHHFVEGTAEESGWNPDGDIGQRFGFPYHVGLLTLG